MNRILRRIDLMPQNKWTINSSSGGNDGNELVGCKIKQTSTGYDFTKPNNDVLASTTSTTLPFSFPSFDYKTHSWTVTVTSLGSTAGGSWSNNDQSPEQEVGSWSADATVDADDEDAGAASAYA
jgi:hypothetical protein